MPFWARESGAVFPAPATRIHLARRDVPNHLKRREYVYESLTETHDFRLLELLPGNKNEQIRCRLKLARLAAQPLYNAVSYTWGQPPADKTILVNDLEFRVRQNLYELLLDLRHPRHSQTYWIDAICINQRDNLERSAQVRRMALIFQTAVGVVAWLKNHRFPLASNDDARVVSVSGALRLGSPTYQHDHTYQQDQRPDLAAIEAFFDHEYWRRRWIIQELALARSALICCGTFTVPFTYVRTLIQLYSSWITNYRGRDVPRRRAGSIENSLAARILDLQGSPRGPDVTLEQLLRDYASTECAEPLDNVYALVSMSRLASESFPVSYDVSKLDLLLTTVEFSSARQSLNPTKAIPFALALGKQLGIKMDELVPTARALRIRPETGGRDCHVVSTLCRRGIVTSSRVDDVALFGRAQALRERCQGLTHFDTTFPISRNIQPIREATSASDAYFSAGIPSDCADIWGPCDQWTVSPRDLFAFIWQRTHLAYGERSLEGMYLGFASARTEAGDVVYQFPGTSVAILLRKVAGGSLFEIRGRARLARVTVRDAFMLNEAYEEPTQEDAEDLSVASVGWRTLDLIRLASAEL
ncbi:hypothetical protein A1O7_08369 [Cladophialophora yegresii CBS 114405]|uniref:Heterokaryon incompatibility domain-containing protein n=1 Tax=Cladophialophora yegresii CBS 114405 TaxID=1182544 RepID=W9VIF2_9EURO|nr:uncharacterized protein A1O7_08369 [Cladophialophora yegresii CBS 114405]EXJ55442.1 hypothetical protein A1O7_08369 [Cladophialophora yegresii CBS 114405]